MKSLLNITAALLLLLPFGAQADYPPDSVYQLDVELQGHDGSEGNIDMNAGEPTIVTMFYGSCPHICPMLIASIQQVVAQLDEDEREKLSVLMVSLDAERDTPESLAKLADERNVDSERWTLATADANDVRKIAAALRIRFRKLADGNFNHTSEMILLDAQGREITRSDKLGRPAPEFVTAVKDALD
ncbi:MAG: SCO family protein [Gammaproteobacteria bacterium]|nr:SCO family protein [Gammaproteobacteria bacterium]